MNKKIIRIIIFLLMVIIGGGTLLSAPQKVVVISIKGQIDKGMAREVITEIDKAHDMNARAIILDMDTPGGYVDPAIKICNRIYSSRIPVIAFINKKAWSAGALIALSAPKIVFSKGASMGAAEPRPATEKNISVLKATFRSWAEKNSRNPEIASAMVDKRVPVDGLTERGQILSLSPQQALDHGYTEYIAVDMDDLLTHMKLADSEIVRANLKDERNAGWFHSTMEFLAGFWVSTFLLTVGLLCLFLEIIAFNGALGAAGLFSILLFFTANIVVGNVAWWIIFIFFVGFGLLCVELFITPGWGLMGVSGIMAMFFSLMFSMGEPARGGLSMVISTITLIVAFAVSARKLPQSKIWKRLTLSSSESRIEGYSAVEERRELEGALGVALNDLRPAGTALINDERIDVVTNGGYIKKDSPVRVVKVESMRVVVETVEGEW